MGEDLGRRASYAFSAFASPIPFPSPGDTAPRRLEHEAENIRSYAVADHLDQIRAAYKIQVRLTPFDFYLLSGVVYVNRDGGGGCEPVDLN